MWIKGKNVIITGASSGIGFYLSIILATKYGCNIIGVGRTKQKLEKAKKEIDLKIENYTSNNPKKQKGCFSFYLFDVSILEEWDKFKKHLKEINFNPDIIINNAGVMLSFNKFENQTLEEITKVFNTNFYASVYSYKTFIDDLKLRKGGFINISSSAALCPVIGTAIYSASKAALKNWTEVLIQEHKKDLYVSYVCPGYTKTDLFRNEKELSKLVKAIASKPEKIAKKIAKKISKKRKRIVLGIDAHLMSGLYRLSPRTASSTISNVLKISKDKMFEKIF